MEKETWGKNYPGRYLLELRRILSLPFIQMMMRFYGVGWDPSWRIFGLPIIQRFPGSSIKLGKGIDLRSWARSNPVTPFAPNVLATRTKRAEINIGNGSGMTGASIIAAENITLGENVTLGSNSIIIDLDFHPVNVWERELNPKTSSIKPVLIEDSVFIGTRSIILKGTTIGKNSVVGAGSVVSGRFPSNVILAGNPAKVIKELE